VPGGIGVGLGVGSNIDTGLLAIQGIAVVCGAPADLVTAPQPDAMKAIASRLVTRRSMWQL
jgi:hypothetical protein